MTTKYPYLITMILACSLFANIDSINVIYSQDLTPVVFRGHSEDIALNLAFKSRYNVQLMASSFSNGSLITLSEVGIVWHLLRFQLGGSLRWRDHYPILFLPGASIAFGKEHRNSIFFRFYTYPGKSIVEYGSGKISLGIPVFNFVTIAGNYPFLGAFTMDEQVSPTASVLPSAQSVTSWQIGFESYLSRFSFTTLLGFVGSQDVPNVRGFWSFEPAKRVWIDNRSYTTYSFGVGLTLGHTIFKTIITAFGYRFEAPSNLGGKAIFSQTFLDKR